MVIVALEFCKTLPMKTFLLNLVLLLLHLTLGAQQSRPENIFIITTDGFRWQEIFNGADNSLIGNTGFVKDTAMIQSLYGSSNKEDSRKLLMPFVWNYIARNGQLWGNRKYQNQVVVTNPYNISYAGYNELLTGYPDPSIRNNKARFNSNGNLLGFLNEQPSFKDKVALFGSWKLFDYIVKFDKDSFMRNCGYNSLPGDSLTITEKIINSIQQEKEQEELPVRSDLLTYSLAMEYAAKHHPRVLYVGFGETDEFAHQKRYDQYLQQANQFDKFLSGLWSMVQSDTFYRNKTAFFITTDHGRGKKDRNWMKHGAFINGSNQSWLMMMGPGIPPVGEVKTSREIRTSSFAQSIASMLGQYFITDHEVEEADYSLLSGQ